MHPVPHHRGQLRALLRDRHPPGRDELPHLSCPAVATTFANITIVDTPSNHFPIGTLDCNRSGCHTATNVNAGGFRIGTANLTAPTLTVAGHTSVANAVPSCQTCHETAAFAGWSRARPRPPGTRGPLRSTPATPRAGTATAATPPRRRSRATRPRRQAREPHPDQCALRAVPHHRRQLRALRHGGDRAQGHQQQLRAVPCLRPELRQHGAADAGAAAVRARPATSPPNPPNGTAQNRLRAVPLADRVHQLCRHGHEARGVHGMTCMSCHEIGMKWKTNTRQAAVGARQCQPPRGPGLRRLRLPHLARQVGARPRGRRPAPPPPAAAASATRARRRTPPRCVAAPSAGLAGALTVGPSITARVAGTRLRQLPRRGQRHRQAAEPHHHQRQLRKLPHDARLAAGDPRRSPQVRGTLRQLPQRRTAPGKPANHLASSDTCETCHTTNAWTPARFDHAAVAAAHLHELPRCACTPPACRASPRADHRAMRHLPRHARLEARQGRSHRRSRRLREPATTTRCASACRRHMSTQPRLRHLPQLSGLDARCTSATPARPTRATTAWRSPAAACHTPRHGPGALASPADAGTCAGCHAKDFKPDAHPKTSSGPSYTVSELDNCSGACHVYTDATLARSARVMPGPYHRVTDATFKH